MVKSSLIRCLSEGLSGAAEQCNRQLEGSRLFRDWAIRESSYRADDQLRFADRCSTKKTRPILNYANSFWISLKNLLGLSPSGVSRAPCGYTVNDYSRRADIVEKGHCS